MAMLLGRQKKYAKNVLGRNYCAGLFTKKAHAQSYIFSVSVRHKTCIRRPVRCGRSKCDLEAVKRGEDQAGANALEMKQEPRKVWA